MNQAMHHDRGASRQRGCDMFGAGCQRNQPGAGTRRGLCRQQASASETPVSCHYQNMPEPPLMGVGRPFRQPGFHRRPVTTPGNRLLPTPGHTVCRIQGFKNYLAGRGRPLASEQPRLEANKGYGHCRPDHIALGGARGRVQPGGQIYRQHRCRGPVAPADQCRKGFTGRARYARAQHGIHDQAGITEKLVKLGLRQTRQLSHLDTICKRSLPRLAGITAEFFRGCNGKTLDDQPMPAGIGGHQIPVAPVITGTTKNQNRRIIPPVSYQPAKCRLGRRLHQLEAINTLLINHIAINLPDRIGGKQRVW